jgi:molybdate transport system ATP-binding protein
MRHRVGALNIDVDFQLTQPWTILFGPSGSGKTTILRAIAGLTKADQASLELSARRDLPSEANIVFEDTRAGNRLPPHLRRIGFAPQRASLFPHLTVLGNVSYGFKVPYQGEMRADAARILELLRIAPLAHKRPHQLSGGEAQRVNLARALGTYLSVPQLSCRLFLLDEPFSGLDTTLRDDLILNLRAWQATVGIPVLSVTHDIAEAFQLNAEVIKLSNGRITHQGPAAVVLAEERTRLLAQLNGPAKAGGPAHGSQ